MSATRHGRKQVGCKGTWLWGERAALEQARGCALRVSVGSEPERYTTGLS